MNNKLNSLIYFISTILLPTLMSKRSAPDSQMDGSPKKQKPSSSTSVAGNLADAVRFHILGAMRYLQETHPSKKLVDVCSLLKGGYDPDCMEPAELLNKVACMLWIWEVLDAPTAENLPDVLSHYIQHFWMEDMQDKEKVSDVDCLPYMPAYNEAAKRWGSNSTMDSWVDEERQQGRKVLAKLEELYRCTGDEDYKRKVVEQQSKLSSMDNAAPYKRCIVDVAERRLKDLRRTLKMEDKALWLILPNLTTSVILATIPKRTGLPLPVMEGGHDFAFAAKAVPKYDKNGRVGEYSVEECRALCEELDCGREGMWWSMDALSHKFLYEEVFQLFSVKTDDLSFTLRKEFDDRIEHKKFEFDTGKEFWKEVEDIDDDDELRHCYENHMMTLRDVTVRGLDGSFYDLEKNFTLGANGSDFVELTPEQDEDSKKPAKDEESVNDEGFQVHWYFGFGGGKSITARMQFPDLWVSTGGSFKGYGGQDTVLFDEFNSPPFKIDMLIYLLKREPGCCVNACTPFRPKTIIIITEEPMDTVVARLAPESTEKQDELKALVTKCVEFDRYGPKEEGPFGPFSRISKMRIQENQGDSTWTTVFNFDRGLDLMEISVNLLREACRYLLDSEEVKDAEGKGEMVWLKHTFLSAFRLEAKIYSIGSLYGIHIDDAESSAKVCDGWELKRKKWEEKVKNFMQA